MPRVQTKICGLSSPETVDAALAGGASHVGFVFYPRSPRHLSFEHAAGLSARIPEQVARVGVFVDPEDALLDQAIRSARPAIVQLHSVDPARASLLASRLRRSRISVWVAIGIRRRSDLDAAKRYLGTGVERLLYDARTEADQLPGGMGVRFDWSLLNGHRHHLPWALAGGLAPENVAEAVDITGARMVDVSSGVERAPGVKDVDKIARFLQAVAAL